MLRGEEDKGDIVKCVGARKSAKGKRNEGKQGGQKKTRSERGKEEDCKRSEEREREEDSSS